MTAYNKTHKKHKSSGYALIIMIVIIGLGVLLFFLQRAGVFNPRPKDPNTPGIMPWAEWKARQMLQAQSQQPEQAEPNIAGPLRFYGNATEPETNDGRGQIELYIGPQSASGNWSGTYYKGPEEMYDITFASYDGSFYPDKKYVDENGNEDPSKLYFLCVGEFQMQLTRGQTVQILVGEIYVRLWLDKDDNILDGRLFLTSNYKDYKEFTFRGRARKPENIF
jgi:hypothetical protein